MCVPFAPVTFQKGGAEVVLWPRQPASLFLPSKKQTLILG